MSAAVRQQHSMHDMIHTWIHEQKIKKFKTDKFKRLFFQTFVCFTESRIEFIRSKLSIFSAHVSGVSETAARGQGVFVSSARRDQRRYAETAGADGRAWRPAADRRRRWSAVVCGRPAVNTITGRHSMTDIASPPELLHELCSQVSPFTGVCSLASMVNSL